MKRRLNIGVALIHEPEIIIMDEPTVGIDPQSRNYILETVKRLNEEKQMTVLYTSHYMEEVEFLCNRIYIIDMVKSLHLERRRILKIFYRQKQPLTLRWKSSNMNLQKHSVILKALRISRFNNR